MIIKGIFELVYILLSVVLAPFSLPALPDGIQSIFDEIVGYLTGAAGISNCNVVGRTKTQSNPTAPVK